MKLNWFSPLPPAPTGIAQYSATILPELSAKAEITAWTDQNKWDPALDRYARVNQYSLNSVDWSKVNAADVSIFHIGNNIQFHEHIYELSRVHAGVIVLHDVRLQDLFWGRAIRRHGGIDEYVALMQRYHGSNGALAARSFVRRKRDICDLAEDYPMVAPVIENALGVVVHSSHSFDTLRGKCAPALAYLHFPYRAASDMSVAEWKRNRTFSPSRALKAIIIGYLGPNRRISSLLEALGRMDARKRFQFHVYGPVWDENWLLQKIEEHKLQNIVFLHGYTPADRVDALIADADLAVNLRYPTMGEASMSQLQIWDHELPSIVTRTGWYATMPEDTTLFVEIEREIDDLRRHLTAFAENPGIFTRLGVNGRRILIDDHAPERYVSNFLAFCEEATNWRANTAMLESATRAGHQMSLLLGNLDSSPLCGEVVERLHTLYSGRRNGTQPVA